MRFLYSLCDLPALRKTAASHEQVQQEPRDSLPTRWEHMERGNEKSEEWWIEIVSASGIRDSVRVAAIVEGSARLGEDG
jgi:hypothetical protein